MTNGRFPPGATTEKAKKPLPQKNHGWAVFVLPNMEQAHLVAGYDWDKDWNDKDSPNVEIARQPVATFFCPSSPAPQV